MTKTKEQAIKNPELGDRWNINGTECQVGVISSYDQDKTKIVYAFSKDGNRKHLGTIGEEFNAMMCWHDFLGNFAIPNE